MRNMYLLSLGLLLALTENIMKVTTCGVGLSKIKGKCTDDNECEYIQPPVCGENAICNNTYGSYYCHCNGGFEPTHHFTQIDGIKCKDINECANGSAVCGPNAVCVNSAGDYSCTCKNGYISSNGKETFIAEDRVQCIDRNECLDGSAVCGPNAECVNSAGGYLCTCKNGYISSNGKEMFIAEDGVQCIDRNECADGSAVCGPNAVCANSEGGYSCTCKNGYISSNGKETFIAEDGVQCIGVCDIDKSICGEGTCTNSKDGHECVCKAGFTNYGHKQMKCTELNCNTSISESKGSQASPKLTELVSLMTNTCMGLSGSESVRKERFTQMDGERHLEAFLKALDDLLRGGFQGNNHEVSALFNIVENMLKLIGPLLSESQTKRSATETEVELLVKRGSSPPDGDFNISTSSTRFASHWDTATGKTYHGFTTAALLTYKSLGNYLNQYFNRLETPKQKFKINSKVLTATVSNTKTANLEKLVTLTFSHLERSDKDHTCVFWDPELEGGAWSKEGCTTMSLSDAQTVCSCNHLSSFAVLMALYDIGDVYQLSLITWVGLPLSLVCLLICIATFYLVRSIQSTRNTIHLHLCVSLFIAYFVFLVGIARTENKVGCAVVAGVLHYFFLASFCWMCLEGVQLFRMVVLVFNTTLRPIYMFAAGYGVPAVIVAISASAHASGYGTDGYCWLNVEDGFIWSFYGPVCAIIIVNVFFFLITIWKLAEKFSSLNPDLNNLRKIKAFTVTAIAQLCVLGIMWVFGCFQFNKDTLAMSYIFTILSSLQGVLMFIMHCWLSKQVREEYAKVLSCICTPQKRKYSEFGSNQTSKSQASRSVQHTGESHI